MRKTVAALIMALLITAGAGILLVNSAMANPFTNSQYSGSTGAPAGAPSPTVSILYPEDNNAYNTDSITLNFNTSVEQISETSPHQVAVRGMRIIESFLLQIGCLTKQKSKSHLFLMRKEARTTLLSR